MSGHVGKDGEEMVHDHIERLTKLEITVQSHTESLATLGAMEKHLRAIKWCGVGWVSFYIFQKFGFVEGLEKILKFV